MIKSRMICSKNPKIRNKQIEVVNVYSMAGIKNINDPTNFEVGKISVDVESVLKSKFKDADYKILLVTDETKESIKVLEIKVLLNSEEQINYLLKNYKSKYKIDYALLNNEEELKSTISEFEIKVQKWSDEIRDYLRNEFDFKNGKVRIEASIFNEEVQSFWITASGKGINDDIVWALNEMSKVITLSKNIIFDTEDKFSFINSYFKS